MHFFFLKITDEELNPCRFRVVSIFFLRKYEQIFIGGKMRAGRPVDGRIEKIIIVDSEAGGDCLTLTQKEISELLWDSPAKRSWDLILKKLNRSNRYKFFALIDVYQK